MTVIRSNSAEGGTNGVVPTPANSGGASGNAWDSVTVAAGERLEFDSDGQLIGTMSYVLEKLDATAGALRMQWGPVTNTDPTLIAKLRMYRTAYPPAGVSHFVVQMGEWTGNKGVSLRTNPDGTLLIHDFQGFDSDDGTVAYPLNQWVQLELEVKWHATEGEARGRLYNAAGALLDTVEILAVPTGVDTEKFMTFGWLQSTAATRDNELTPWWMDDLSVETVVETRGGYWS